MDAFSIDSLALIEPAFHLGDRAGIHTSVSTPFPRRVPASFPRRGSTTVPPTAPCVLFSQPKHPAFRIARAQRRLPLDS